MGDLDEGVCSLCQNRQDDVMKRDVHGTERQLCRRCADAKRSIRGQKLASRPPTGPNTRYDPEEVSS